MFGINLHCMKRFSEALSIPPGEKLCNNVMMIHTLQDLNFFIKS